MYSIGHGRTDSSPLARQHHCCCHSQLPAGTCNKFFCFGQFEPQLGTCTYHRRGAPQQHPTVHCSRSKTKPVICRLLTVLLERPPATIVTSKTGLPYITSRMACHKPATTSQSIAFKHSADQLSSSLAQLLGSSRNKLCHEAATSTSTSH